MFLAGDSAKQRADRIYEYLRTDPGVGLLLAAVNFEWTVSRAVLFLSETPNAVLRTRMADFYSLQDYKELWKQEVIAFHGGLRLTEIIENWNSVKNGFSARNRLVHGKYRVTRNMATPHVDVLLRAVNQVDAYCKSLGIDLQSRLPVRRASKSPKEPNS